MLTLSIISPEKKILELECKQITVPTKDGEITILPSHEPLYSLLSPGEAVVWDKNGAVSHIVVTNGFVSVGNNVVKLLTDFGIRTDEIDQKAVEDAKDRAQKLMAEKSDEETFAVAEGEMLKSLAQLRALARKKKTS